jgi:hypothetical protein
METLLGAGNFDTDPITVLADEYFYRIHWSEFTVQGGGTSWGVASGSGYGVYSNSTSSATLYAPVLLPRGVTITGMKLFGANGASAGAITATLESIDCTTTTVAQTTHGTATIPISTSQNSFDAGTLAVTVDDTPGNYVFYYVKIVMTGPAGSTASRFQGVELAYTRPNLGASV